jgi:hypothetical protein
MIKRLIKFLRNIFNNKEEQVIKVRKYITECPTCENKDGLKLYLSTKDCKTKYSGWLYVILEEGEE